MLLRYATLLFASSLIVSCKAADPAPPHADTPTSAAAPAVAYTNAVIYQHPHADTLVIQGKRIVFIGQASAARQQYPTTQQWHDVERAFIGPGFIDNHNHVFEAASDIGADCDVSAAHDIAGYTSLLRQCQRELDLEPNSWMMGYGHDISQLLQLQDESPRQLLDRLFPDNPAVLMEQTSHSMWVNSKALQRAGITSQSADPQGGRILHEDDGSLSGILLDNAGDRLFEIAWNQQPDLANAHLRGLKKGLRQLATVGITTVGDGRLYWKRGWLTSWQTLEQQQQLTARVSVRPWIYPADPAAAQLAFFRQAYQNDLSRLLIVNQVKLYSDGLIQNGTARVLQPYQQTINPDLPTGLDYIAAEPMAWWLQQLDQLGYGAHIHAIGDGGTRQALDAIAKARAAGSTRRYGLTHLELVAANDLPRFVQLHVDADMQIGNDDVLHGDHAWAAPWLGEERATQLMPVGALRAAGANVTLSSDWNVNELNPLVSIANALELKGQQFPTAASAIDAYTINAAHALGLQDITGSLTVGKAADLVILDHDISHATPNEIRQTRCLLTMLNGQIVYQSDAY